MFFCYRLASRIKGQVFYSNKKIFARKLLEDLTELNNYQENVLKYATLSKSTNEKNAPFETNIEKLKSSRQIYFSSSLKRFYAQEVNVKLEKIDEKEKNLTEIEQRQIKLAEEKSKLALNNALDEEKQKINITNLSPKILEPYIKLMRLDKPAPIYLAFWPGAWAILGAASYQHASIPDFYLLGVFAVGAIAMRSAGCIVNDIWDRKLDKQVERTKDRPLASGQVGLPMAVALLGTNLTVALSALLQLNLTTQVLGACCLFPVAFYPAAKLFTNWPQAILGLTFNWGALMGWSAVLCSSTSQIQNIFSFLPAVALYAACVNWTLFYDTIYAFQDKEHDKKVGIKSTALHLENNIRKWLLGFSSLSVANLGLFGWMTYQEPIYYISLGLAMAHFLKQIFFVRYSSPESCNKQFKSNNTIGVIIGFGLLASILIK
jgi:4-hydroxybenzoate polyprenyltransferase